VRERSRAPDGRIPAAVALLAGLLLIVAAGVGGDAHAGRSRQASPLAVRVLVDVGLAAVAVTALLIAGGLASALWSRRKKEPPPEQRVYQAPPVPWALRVALLVFFLLLAAGVVAVFRGASSDERTSRPAPPATGALPLQDERPSTGERSIGADAPVVAAVTVLGLTAAVLVTRRPRRRRWAAPQATPVEPRPTAPAPAGEFGVEDLLAEHDARRAVVAAYARMERVLAAAGVARHPSDAPFEYLARVRRAIAPVGPPAARLTELFERAKFSAAGVDRAMQAEAVAALRAVIEQGTVPA
jgi:hypothetical protein